MKNDSTAPRKARSDKLDEFIVFRGKKLSKKIFHPRPTSHYNGRQVLVCWSVGLNVHDRDAEHNTRHSLKKHGSNLSFADDAQQPSCDRTIG